MDPLGALQFASYAITAMYWLGGPKYHRRRTYINDNLRFFKIFDIDLNKEPEMSELATFPQHFQELEAANPGSEVNMNTVMAALPRPPNTGIRIYVEQDFDLGHWGYIAHLTHDIFNDSDVVGHTADTGHSGRKDRPVKRGFRACCNQWMLPVPEMWLEVSSFVPVDPLIYEENGSASLMTITKEVCIVQQDNDTLISTLRRFDPFSYSEY